VWTISPTPQATPEIINHNLLDRPAFQQAVEHVSETRLPVILNVEDQSSWFGIDGNRDILQTTVAFPVFENFDPSSEVVGMITAVVPWEVFFSGLFMDGTTEKVTVVMSNTCNETFTFEINGSNASFLGEEDLHDPKYDHVAVEHLFAGHYNPEDESGDHCIYTMTIYPSESFEAEYKTLTPLFFCLATVAVFVFAIITFLIFDCLVQKRQRALTKAARKHMALVSSLFPKKIRRKLLREQSTRKIKNKSGKAGLRSYLDKESGADEGNKSNNGNPPKPIADLFSETTIMFADIAGFTAWSSTREPSQVFILLESIYRQFDSIAKRRRVFKVEVVGDCYVAVCGLPDPQHNHFVIMCRFAQDCLNAMRIQVKQLEVQLGPDTADLMLRVGIHSGPVVAGVLRGDKSRFQLFGDTMNTASRMESNGVPDNIQVSQETANLLKAAGKESWLIPREDKIEAKGKGLLQTYFLTLDKKGCETESNCSAETLSLSGFDLSNAVVKKIERRNRIADWTVEVLGKILRDMVARRKSLKIMPDDISAIETLEAGIGDYANTTSPPGEMRMVIDEVQEIIFLPDYRKDHKSISRILHSSKSSRILHPSKSSHHGTTLHSSVMDELRDYVWTIASLYNDNPFHNFEHASHVAMSVTKLLSRIVAPDLDHEKEKNLHDHTYGITSDPLTHFAIVFAALIHDVDHTGVPNAQLVKEGAEVARMYNNRSVAEQNSVDLAMGLLLEPRFKNLRSQIYTNVSEYKRFRQLVVNSVMATDIVDKDLKKLQQDRWETAFGDTTGEDAQTSTNRKATIVIEHLIQASDVSHTMQHWSIYRKWNERFFFECYQAYRDGRAEKDPTETWYKGEIGFFDFYIIPLAKKLKDCGVFGVSSDEYLSYAMENRRQWEATGEEVVAEMVSKLKQKGLLKNDRPRRNLLEKGSSLRSLMRGNSQRSLGIGSSQRSLMRGTSQRSLMKGSSHSSPRRGSSQRNLMGNGSYRSSAQGSSRRLLMSLGRDNSPPGSPLSSRSTTSKGSH